MHTFTKNQSIFIDDVEYKVIRSNAESAQLENQVTGEFKSTCFNELMSWYTSGRLQVTKSRPISSRKRVPIDALSSPTSTIRSKAALMDSRRKTAYIEGIRKEGHIAGVKRLQEVATKICQKIGDHRPPHVATLYSWLRKFNQFQGDFRSLINNYEARGGYGKPRLDVEVEQLIDARIEEVLLRPKAGTAGDVHLGVLLDIQQLNTLRIESEHLEVPGLRTIQRRIQNLWAYDFALARYGRAEADRRFGMYLGARRVDRILQLVEIDHSPLDILVVDEAGAVIGRPSVTVIIDRKSRCILGLHISLAGHGTQAVFECIRHALMPKRYLEKDGTYGDMGLEWPCFGWFTMLVMDNGPEFHAEAVVDALMSIGCGAEYAPSRDPNSKPHVERFLRTLNYGLIHTLPGTTLAKVHDRIGFKAENDACLNLEQLDRIIHRWICNVYHQRPHRGLDRRVPLSVWKEDAALHPPQLKLNHDDVEVEFSQVCTSKVQHYGIDLNTFVYVSPQLLTLRRTLPDDTKVSVKWPLDDAGHIWVWDPHQSKYFKVSNKDSQYLGLTVAQAKVAKKAKADPMSDYARTNALAKDIFRNEVNQAQKAKKLKDRKAAAQLANRTSAKSRGKASQVPVVAQPVIDRSNIPTLGSDTLLDIPVTLPELPSHA